MGGEPRCECGKISYPSQLAAARQQSVVGIYRCSESGAWHRSSQPRKDNIERARRARQEVRPSQCFTTIAERIPEEVVERLRRLA